MSRSTRNTETDTTISNPPSYDEEVEGVQYMGVVRVSTERHRWVRFGYAVWKKDLDPIVTHTQKLILEGQGRIQGTAAEGYMIAVMMIRAGRPELEKEKLILEVPLENIYGWVHDNYRANSPAGRYFVGLRRRCTRWNIELSGTSLGAMVKRVIGDYKERLEDVINID